MPDYYWLTPDDREFLDDMKRKVRNQVQPPRYSEQPEQLYQAPEIYVARTPPEGINALTRVVGDPPADYPGVATCDIYKLIKDYDGQRAYLAPHPGNDLFQRPVYNLNLDPVGGNRWVLVERDKDGSWWCRAPWPFPSRDDTVIIGPGNGGTGTATGAPGGGIPNDPDVPFPPVDNDCTPIYFHEVDVFCEATAVSLQRGWCETAGTGTATGAAPTEYVYMLNLYRRRVLINFNPYQGCLTKTELPWEYIRTIGCCDPDCTDPDVGTGATLTTVPCCDELDTAETVAFQLNAALFEGVLEDCTIVGTLTRDEGGLYLWTNAIGTTGCVEGGAPVVTVALRLYCIAGLWRASGTIYRTYTTANINFNVALTGNPELLGSFNLGEGRGFAELIVAHPCPGPTLPPIQSGTGSPSGGTVSTSCCPDELLPETLYLTISFENCACLNGSYTLTWDGSAWSCSTTESECTGGANNQFNLTCSGGVWSLQAVTNTCAGFGTITPLLQSSCHPLSLSGSGANVPTVECTECSSGAVSFQITE